MSNAASLFSLSLSNMSIWFYLNGSAHGLSFPFRSNFSASKRLFLSLSLCIFVESSIFSFQKCAMYLCRHRTVYATCKTSCYLKIFGDFSHCLSLMSVNQAFAIHPKSHLHSTFGRDIFLSYRFNDSSWYGIFLNLIILQLLSLRTSRCLICFRKVR